MSLVLEANWQQPQHRSGEDHRELVSELQVLSPRLQLNAEVHQEERARGSLPLPPLPLPSDRMPPRGPQALPSPAHSREARCGAAAPGPLQSKRDLHDEGGRPLCDCGRRQWRPIPGPSRDQEISGRRVLRHLLLHP